MINTTNDFINVIENEEKEKDYLAEPILKVLGIIILFGLSIVMGILPLKLKIFQSNLRVTGIVNALSAGIFISVSLLHLLPEAHEIFANNLETKFPFAFLIAIISYSFILVIEKLAFDTHNWLEIHVHPDLHQHEHKNSFKQENSTFLVSVKEKYACCPDKNKGEMKKIENNKKNDCDKLMEACSHDEILLNVNVDNNEISQRKETSPLLIIEKKNSLPNSFVGHIPNHENNFPVPNDSNGRLQDTLILKKSSSFCENIKKREIRKNELAEHKKNEKDYDFDESNFKELLSTKINLARTISYHDKHREKHQIKQKKIDEESKATITSPLTPEKKHTTRQIGKLTPYILLIALSFHGIFEGIAIGLQKEVTQLANLLIAVALHKWAEALTLGMSFNKNESRNNLSVRMITIFSSTGPLGIGIGWGLAQTSDVIAAIFMSISAGTFLYISASEVVVEEFSISKNKWWKFLFFVIGVIIISALWFLENE